MNLNDRLDFFFRDPTTEPVIQPGNNRFSNLYLLRRDINTCFASAAIWPGVMGIMAGIDLVAKFHAGTDVTGVGDRFRTFVDQYITHDAPNSEVIYQLRNSMLHSFGLYSKRNVPAAQRAAAGFERQDYAFLLRGNPQAPGAIVTLLNQHPVQTVGAAPNPVRILVTDYQIDVHALRQAFDGAMAAYRQDIENTPQLQANFLMHANTDIHSLLDMYAVTVAA
ncbi:MAG TPA: hypothetical protein V6C86_22085 [Oculatellaceae cyanobacterium]